MVDGNVQQDVGSGMWTELKECVRQGHFLIGAVLDGVIIALEAQ